MSQLAASAMLFLRGDVQPAKQTLLRSYSKEEVYESIRMPYSERPFFTPGFLPGDALQYATRIESLSAKEITGKRPAQKLSKDVQLAWRPSGLVSIDTSKSQALIGYVTRNRIATTNLSAELDNQHCAITLSSLDGRSIEQSSKLLLTAGSKVENTGMEWNANRTSVIHWGTAPTRIEVVSGHVTLRGFESRKAVTATPLASNGRPLAEPIPAVKTKGGWQLQIGAIFTVWYFIELK